MDIDVFESEVLKIEKLLYHVSWSYLGSREDCADAVQEALTRAWKQRDTLRSLRAFKGWVVQILSHVCQDQLRRQSKLRFVPLEDSAVTDLKADGSAYSVVEFLQLLSPEHRVAVVLFYIEGYRISDVAALLSVPQGTVKSRLTAARACLRRAAEAGTMQGDVVYEKV